MSSAEQSTTEQPRKKGPSKIVIFGGAAIVLIIGAFVLLRGGVTVSTAGVTTNLDACNEAMSKFNGQVKLLGATTISWQTIESLRRQTVETEKTCGALAESTLGATDVALQESMANLKKMSARLARAQHATVRVAANQEWQSSGLNAVAGDHLLVTATGQWSIAGPIASAKYGLVGPDGYEKNPSWGSSIYGGRIGSLATAVATAGTRPPSAFTGVGNFKAPTGGPVQFRCNDDGVNNNDGHMEVDLVVLPPPG